MTLIRSEHVVYQYFADDVQNQALPEKNAVDDINMEIEEGSFVAIVGKNGSGKSTFARHINGILLPTRGKMYVDGKCTLDEKNLFEIRQKIGMVFQNPDNQIIGNVVEEDVAFGPENIGVPPEEIQQRVWQCLKMVDMFDCRRKSPLLLSGGQKQRVSIAGVLAMQSDCIVLDEPTAMLDPLGRKEVLDILHTLNRKHGVTVILITHYMDEAVAADRVLIVDEGKIIMDDVPKKIFPHIASIKAIGLDVPQVVELSHELREAGIPIKTEILTVDELVDELCQYV